MSISNLLKVYSCLSLGLLLSCDGNNQETNSDTQFSTEVSAIALDMSAISSAAAIGDAYIRRIDLDFNAAGAAIDAFADEVARFLATPDESSLQQVRESWITANTAYEQITLHRYFAESALEDTQALQLFQLDYRLNHWPILPGYVDYVSNYPDSGIVNDMTVILESGYLRSQHGAFDINEVSIGFHVLEFLLWGENIDSESPRPATDFLVQRELSAQQQADGMNVVDLANNRRRELLQLLTTLLDEDFENLASTWSASSTGYRPVSTASAVQTLQYMLDGIIGLLREEILANSLYLMLNGEFGESRPSPFSDSSQNAVSAQLSSLELLLLETRQQEGGSLDQLLNSLSADYQEFFLQNLDASKECLVILFTSASRQEMTTAETEFRVVECINSLTNMIDYLERVLPGNA